jgi:transcriptional accessory protein Tex/SPT6
MKPSTISQKLSSEEKQQLIDLWKQSGKTKKAFAEEYGIKYLTFVDWIRRPDRNRYSVKAKEFIEITPPVVSGIFAEVYLSGGHRIIFHQPFSADFLSRLIK